MPRARVSPEKRKRTARACDFCRRSKLKCNGLYPCFSCSKEGRTCTFGNAYSGTDVRPPPAKRQLLDDGSASSQTAPQSVNIQQTIDPPILVGFDPVANTLQPTVQFVPKATHQTPTHPPTLPIPLPVNQQTLQSEHKQDSGLPQNSSHTHSPGVGTTVGLEEEAVIYNFPRLLEDPKGILQYLGDSATLSYLQIIRKDVESIVGPCPFTLDPQQHQMAENTTVLPRNVRNTHLLPDKATARLLVNAFFTNTSGLCRVVNDEAFMRNLDSYYTDPLDVDPSWLCLFHLTLAIGLVLANPLPGTQAEARIEKLRANRIDQAEIFYNNARNLFDPATAFENADFWSIQALFLMAIYTLTVSKRNIAFAYCGMASRSGFALGLHREETLALFTDEEQALRRNLWRSVFVLDCFLAASMGRPAAISEEDCFGETFVTEQKSSSSSSISLSTDLSCHSSAVGLEASVRSCKIIGIILKRVYSKRKISTKLAQEIAHECELWPDTLDPTLQSRKMTNAGIIPGQGIAILHVNLLYCHTLILLTRPFFLFLLNKVQSERVSGLQRPRRIDSRIEKFSECCVSASCHSIFLAKSALEGSYLSYRNPFVIYYVFAAALIVLSNEFFKLYAIPLAQDWIQTSISIVGYCAETDAIACRLHFILSSFRDIVIRQKGLAPQRQILNRPEDPILNFLSIGTGKISPSSTRRSSLASTHPWGTGSLTSGNSSIIPLSQTLLSNSISSQSPEYTPRRGSLDGNDSLGDGDIDFDAFWRTVPPANVSIPGVQN